MSQNTQTPAETLQVATSKNALPQTRLALLGTYIKPESTMALVRVGREKIRSVTIGDTITGAQVIAIEEGTLTLLQLGRARKLSLPDT